MHVRVSSADSANFTLLVASEDGVYSATISGSSASQIGGQSSVESNGRLHDYICDSPTECYTHLV